MLSLSQITDLFSQGELPTIERKKDWEDVYYGMSLHISGACPRFYDLRSPLRQFTNTVIPAGAWIKPKNYFGERYQMLFDTVLLNRHPRESELTRQWRLSQYKPLTQDPFAKAIQVITGAIFQDSGYSIVIEDQADRDYIWGNNFDGNNLIGYITEKFQTICEDPNGWFVVIPKEPHYRTTTDKIEPEIRFFYSYEVVFKTDDEIIFERDKVRWIVNKVGYFRLRQEPNNNWVNIDPTGGYYPHMLGYIPAWNAGGLKNAKGFYDSWLNAGKPVADEFITEKSSAQLVNKDSSHPYIVEAEEECPECHGEQKIQRLCEECEGGFELVGCPTCGGSGSISHNPGDRMIVPREDMAHELIQVINADIEACKFHSDEVKLAESRILQALHLFVMDERQSGVAKEKDMQTRFQFILRISNDLFDRLSEPIISCILSLRNVAVVNGNIVPAKVPFVVVKPTEFQIKTAADLIEDIKAANEAKMPDYIRSAQIEDYVDKQFGGNEVLIKKSRLINQMDLVAVTPEEDKQLKVLNGSITQRDLQFNAHLPLIIDKIIRDKGKDWFMNAGYDAIFAIVQAEFSAIAPPVVRIQPDEEVVREEI